MLESVHTSDPYLNEIASHLIVAGGKRLRPVLTVVAAQVGGGLGQTDDARSRAASPASWCRPVRCTTTT